MDDIDKLFEEAPEATADDLFDSAPEIGATEEEVSALESGLAGAAQGLTWDFGDEIGGGLKSLFSDKTYEEERDALREYFKQAEEQNPGSYIAGDITGGILPALATGGAGFLASGGKIAAKQGLKQGAKQLAKKGAKEIAESGIKKAAKIGATQGALTGLGRTEEIEDIGQVAEDVATYGTMGGLVGGGLGAIGKGLKSAPVKRMTKGIKDYALETTKTLEDTPLVGDAIKTARYSATGDRIPVFARQSKRVDLDKQGRDLTKLARDTIEGSRKQDSKKISKVLELVDKKVAPKNYNSHLNKIEKSVKGIESFTEGSQKTKKELLDVLGNYKESKKVLNKKGQKEAAEQTMDRLQQLMNRLKRSAEEQGERVDFVNPKLEPELGRASVLEVRPGQKVQKAAVKKVNIKDPVVGPDATAEEIQEAILRSRDDARASLQKSIAREKSVASDLGEEVSFGPITIDDEAGLAKSLKTVFEELPETSKVRSVPIKRALDGQVDYFKKMSVKDLADLRKGVSEVLDSSDQGTKAFAEATRAKAQLDDIIEKSMSEADPRLQDIYQSSMQRYRDRAQVEELLPELSKNTGDLKAQSSFIGKLRASQDWDTGIERQFNAAMEKLDELNPAAAKRIREGAERQSDIAGLMNLGEEANISLTGLARLASRVLGTPTGDAIRLTGKGLKAPFSSPTTLASKSRVAAKMLGDDYGAPSEEELMDLSFRLQGVQGADSYIRALDKMAQESDRGRKVQMFKLRQDPAFKQLMKRLEREEGRSEGIDLPMMTIPLEEE